MFWARINGTGHAAVEDDGKDPAAVVTACGLLEPVERADMEEATVPQARPFGGDTCHVCHQIAKGWAAGIVDPPAGLFTPPEIATGRVMTAEQRRERVQGRAGTSTAPARSASPRGSRGLPEDVDDVSYPPEAGPPIVDGALVVTPEKVKPAKRSAADREFDSET